MVDKDRMAVSFINSLYSNFGVGICTEKTGILLTNRGACFVVDPKHPNTFGGGKRPLHTIIPGFAQKGDARIAFGIMGGWNQSQAHAQFVANISDFKMNIQAALEAPRFSKRTFSGCDVSLENRFNGSVRNDLAAKGHVIDLRGAFSSVMGGGQAVLRDYAAGVNFGASDPRKDGQAAAELPVD